MDLTPVVTDDGSFTLFSEQFQVSYHSLQGAIDESITVFLSAGLDKLLLSGYKRINILEIGFGTGLNAFLTYIRTHTLHDILIEYTGIEAYPVPSSVVSLLDYPAHIGDGEFSDVFIRMHKAPPDKMLKINNFELLKKHMFFENLSYQNQFDLIYFDAFAPTTQPELWDCDLLSQMYSALAEEGLLVTYCSKGSFKRNLKSVGFQVEALAGPGRKREMTRAWKSAATLTGIKSKLKF